LLLYVLAFRARDISTLKRLSKLLRMQQAVATSVAARPIGPNALALQVTQTACTPFPLTVTQQQLVLQAGLTLNPASFSGPPPPWILEPRSTQLALFAVSHDPARAASSVAQLVCRLHTAMSIAQAATAALHVSAFDASGHPAAPESRASTAGKNARSAVPGAALPAWHLPASAAQLFLRGRAADVQATVGAAPTDAINIASDGEARRPEATFEPSAGALRRAGAGESSALCAHVHTFSVELSSFSAMAVLSRGKLARRTSDTDDMHMAPVIAFMGPKSVQLGQDAALMWRVRWPSEAQIDAMPGAHAQLTCICVHVCV
jgi:hypothetical protein